MRRKTAILTAMLLAVILLLTGCGLAPLAEPGTPTEALTLVTASPAGARTQETEAPAEQAGPVIEPQEIADYLFEHGELPENFISKEEAQALGWDSSRNYVSDVAPGKSLGGEYFGNYEGRLPKAKGRVFHACDCRYTGGKRGAERIVYSSDGRIWYTPDHYETFTELFPSK